MWNYNCKNGIHMPRFLSSAARKDLRIFNKMWLPSGKKIQRRAVADDTISVG